MAVPRKIRCPVCSREGDWFDAPFGPFCSKRCKLVDLGKWFQEEHAISEALEPGESNNADHLQVRGNPE